MPTTSVDHEGFEGGIPTTGNERQRVSRPSPWAVVGTAAGASRL